MPNPQRHESQGIELRIDGRAVQVETGSSVLGAIGVAGILITRLSVKGEPRGALCGMGLCQECRVEIDGVPHQRSCMIAARTGMEIRTGSAS